MAVDRIQHHPVTSVPIVLLDTNALMMPFQFRLNLDTELTRLLGNYELRVPDVVLSELKSLAKSNKIAKIAVRLAEKYESLQTTKELRKRSCDEALLALAQQLKAIVVTNDRELLKTLASRGIPTISLRARTHLVLNEGYLPP